MEKVSRARDTAKVKVIAVKESSPRSTEPVNPSNNMWTKVVINIDEDLHSLSNVIHSLPDPSTQSLSSLNHVGN